MIETFAILTLGCKVNQYESRALTELLEKEGLTAVRSTKTADIMIVNTCTVTAESDRKCRQTIRRLHVGNPDSPIVVTGCYAETARESVEKLPSVVAVIGNGRKNAVSEVVLALREGKSLDSLPKDTFLSETTLYEPMNITGFDRTRAYLKIEDGCDNRCTYCKIPDARGNVRSADPHAVTCEAEGLLKRGCRELVLVGIETASYGKDRDDATLASLLGSIDKLPYSFRLRLGSLEPTLLRSDFTDAYALLTHRVPHLHISLQSGSSDVLRAMKRKYNAAQALDILTSISEKINGLYMTTDIIVGFPGETEENFLETVEFCKKVRFLHAHIFPFSARKGTPAATMGNQIPPDIRNERAERLRAVCESIEKERLEEFAVSHESTEVLFETFEDGYAVGHNPEYMEVRVRSACNLHGRIFTVNSPKANGFSLEGSLGKEKSYE